jgi:hypothetical protein
MVMTLLLLMLTMIRVTRRARSKIMNRRRRRMC